MWEYRRVTARGLRAGSGQIEAEPARADPLPQDQPRYSIDALLAVVKVVDARNI